MKKYSPALLSVLTLGALMLSSPIIQADEPQTRAQRAQELNQREQQLNQRERQLNQRLNEYQMNQQLDRREQELEQRDDRISAIEEKIDPESEQTYSARMGWKALDGFANMNTALMEIPKNIVKTTNESNVILGVIGGTVKGVLNTVGRFVTGVTDLVTFPIVTKPIVSPGHVWEDFDAETTYGQVFRLDNAQSTRFDKMQKCDVVGPPC